MSDIAVSITNVSKSFRLPHEKNTGLKQALINFRPGKKYEMQHVLKDISFDIKKGEFFGIIGRNGSGKSTLLKVLAQIYTTEKGGVRINGSLTPFIELGVGFNPELTGRENVYLNGALLGFDRKQVNLMYDEIVEFAELKQFMDQKLKNYSSGMQVRLAFSVAIRAQSDILLIDEVLAVGDAAFQQKCFKYFEKLKTDKRTIIFVSHDMTAIKQFCDRVALIDKGRVAMIGEPFELAREYESLNYANLVPDEKDESPSDQPKVVICDENNKQAVSFEHGSNIVLRATWPSDLDVKHVGFIVYKGSENVFATNSFDQKVELRNKTAQLKITSFLGDGRYRVVLGLFGKTRNELLNIGAEQEFLMFNQSEKGKHNDDWNGICYVQNEWIS
jgi:ABC-type polysaccharide/polyol phosphate transport system ATPase subunit